MGAAGVGVGLGGSHVPVQGSFGQQLHHLLSCTTGHTSGGLLCILVLVQGAPPMDCRANELWTAAHTYCGTGRITSGLQGKWAVVCKVQQRVAGHTSCEALKVWEATVLNG